MSIRGPGVRQLDPHEKVAEAGAGVDPEAEGPIHVHPGALGMGEGNDLLEPVKGSDVDVPRAEQHQGGFTRDVLQGRRQGLRLQTTRRIHGEVLDALAPQAQEPQRPLHGAMDLAVA